MHKISTKSRSKIRVCSLLSLEQCYSALISDKFVHWELTRVCTSFLYPFVRILDQSHSLHPSKAVSTLQRVHHGHDDIGDIPQIIDARQREHILGTAAQRLQHVRVGRTVDRRNADRNDLRIQRTNLAGDRGCAHGRVAV